MRILSLVLLLAGAGLSYGAGKLEYNRDVRPILTENCFACHGPDSAARKADLRLDLRDAAIKSGAIVPGNPQKSTTIARIYSTDKTEIMPPPKSHKTMKAEHKEILKQWIAEGAEYQPHWSFLPAKKWDLPAVKNAGWVRNPIDRFILAELEKQGLSPAPEADRRTLARRLALDLTGLPPVPAEVDEFVNDQSKDFYEKYVDKLMAKPTWGEHRARYWLDAARYADTHGIHFDNFREVWSYREWVINALNANMKFDQFTVEQLAGDLLPNATMDQKVATGFVRANITTSEGGAIDEEYLVLYARDRTETASQVWMGLTTGCAVCHDHKFDPISQKDFYALSAFFNNTTQRAMDGNTHDTPPIIAVPRMEDRARYDAISSEIVKYKASLGERKKLARADFDKWLLTAKKDEFLAKIPTDKLHLHVPLNKGDGKVFDATIDGKPKSVTLDSGYAWEDGNTGGKVFSIKPGKTIELPEAGDFDTKQAFSAGAWVKFPSRAQTGGIIARMDTAENGHRGWDVWYEGGKIGFHLIHNWPSDALKVTTKAILNPANEWQHVFVTYDGSAKASGVKIYLNGVLQTTEIPTDALKGTTKTKVPLRIGEREKHARLTSFLSHDVRIYSRILAAAEVESLAKLSKALGTIEKAADKRTPQEKDELFNWYLLSVDSGYKDLSEKIAKVTQEEVTIRSRGTIAHVMSEKKEPAMAFILNRGDYDKRKDKVTPDVPSSLPAMSADLPKNRLGLAKWLLRPEHPLTARVNVNRFWQELFGTGLVRTSGDFGITGELPSHPELLDWMALEFRSGNWDMKAFFKLLVTSATYRQSAVATKDKIEKDPANKLLSRGPRFRMDAEMVRDHALAASGLLVQKIGGPSVKPYQPEGVWEAVAMIGSNTRDYKRDSGEKLYRRSMYTFWKRAAPPASMDILNAPNRETCAVRRERTNTPLQALLTLNDPQFVEAARFLAEKALTEGGQTDDSKIDFIARRLLARSFTPDELPIVKGSLTLLASDFKTKPDEAKKLLTFGEHKSDPKLDPALLASWTMLVNELMNLDEVLNK
jgi:Protein of unknown function (DUF1553)/Protein of unknown function (DUF1549)/Concanavalin A-like lectin/glucanases superfamily/Planctomycete cytochrome C